jgi:hypothetical protein
MGIGYMPAIQCSLLWFPEHKGLISGLIVAALGSSATLFNMISNNFMNPEGVQPTAAGSDKFFPEDIAQKLPDLINRLVTIFVCMGIVVLLLCFKPEDKEEVIDSAKNEEEAHQTDPANQIVQISENQPRSSSSKLIQVVMSKDFILPFINNVLTLGTGTFIVSL